MTNPPFDYASVAIESVPPLPGSFVDPCEALLRRMLPGQGVKLPHNVARATVRVAERNRMTVESYPASESESYVRLVNIARTVPELAEMLDDWAAMPRPEGLLGRWKGTAVDLIRSLNAELPSFPSLELNSKQLGRRLAELSRIPGSRLSVVAQKAHGNVYQIDLSREGPESQVFRIDLSREGPGPQDFIYQSPLA